jgi:hypothetical protein
MGMTGNMLGPSCAASAELMRVCWNVWERPGSVANGHPLRQSPRPWWNWKTRQPQKLQRSARSCRFDSCRPHQIRMLRSSVGEQGPDKAQALVRSQPQRPPFAAVAQTAEQRPRNATVGSSILSGGPKHFRCSSIGRAPRCYRGGCRFEACRRSQHQKTEDGRQKSECARTSIRAIGVRWTCKSLSVF